MPHQAEIYQAIAKGIQEEGLPVQHERRYAALGPKPPIDCLIYYGEHCTIDILIRQSTTTLRTTNSETGIITAQLPGPDLADPEFFTKITAQLKDYIANTIQQSLSRNKNHPPQDPQ